jgi:hypothetical protein
MSKESWEVLECDESLPEEDGELLCAGTEAHVRFGEAPKRSPPSMALICPDTGKVTMCNTNDLRAQLEQFRLEQEMPACHTAHQLQPRVQSASIAPVAVDDELHGPDGEWLGVVDVTTDGEVFTLLCFETGAQFRRTASAVLADIDRRRLKVYHPGMPYVPPELEEDPRVFIDGNGCS